jgi:hypothetical protein
MFMARPLPRVGAGLPKRVGGKRRQARSEGGCLPPSRSPRGYLRKDEAQGRGVWNPAAARATLGRMTDLLEDDGPPGNAPEFTVSELSGAVKRVIEGEFGLVRVRGEIGRVSRPASGHLYFDLKDDRAVLAAICWKGQAARLRCGPRRGSRSSRPGG